MNCKGVYFEDSDVWGTAPGGWSLTYIAVQYGHICRSKVHHADWCFGLAGAHCFESKGPGSLKIGGLFPLPARLVVNR